jgi:serine/threonine-protein kinase
LITDRAPKVELSPTGELLDGRYRVIERLGEGGFGETFLVDDVNLGRRGVMKLLREHDASESTFDRLRREFALVSKLDHPAIARNLEVGQLANGRPYLVTEWIRGATLEKLLAARTRLSVSDAVSVARSLAGGLGCAHEAGILHRDIKPANIIIPGGDDVPMFDRAKLVDFGAFGELLTNDPSHERLTRTGMFFGTPRYMSPEQIQALPQSPATDVYGLALVLSEMIYGTVPLTERGRSSGQSVLLRIVKEQISLPHDPDVPDALRDLIERSLSKDPSARPRDGSEFASLLEQFRGGLDARTTMAVGIIPPGVAANPPPAPTRASMRRLFAVSESTMTYAAPAAASRSRVGLYVALVLAVAALVALGFLLPVTTGAAPGTSTRNALRFLPWIVGGFALAVGGVVAGKALRRIAHSRLHEVELDAERLLLGLRTRRALSDTLQIEVTRIIARCRDLDERLLGITIMKMIHEYDVASESNERQSALMNVATLLEKLRGRLSPWYARFEKQLALATSALGIATGVITVVAGIIKLTKGEP